MQLVFDVTFEISLPLLPNSIDPRRRRVRMIYKRCSRCSGH